MTKGLPENGVPRRVDRVGEPRESVALLSRGVRVPAAGQVPGQRAGAGEIVSLDEEPRHHSGDLADLDVLQPQLSKEPVTFPLVGGRGELFARRLRIEVFLLQPGVPSKRGVEIADRSSGEGVVVGAHRREKEAEQAVESAVVPFEKVADGDVERVRHGAFAGARRSSSRPRTGWRTSASGAPAENP